MQIGTKKWREVQCGDMVVLNYGDSITLSCDTQGGFLVADGLFDDRLWCVRHGADDTAPKGVENCRFRVLPRLHYLARKARYRYERENSRWARFDKEKALALDKVYRELIEKERMESAQNKTEVSRMIGKAVCFGAALQLQHCQSGCYLTLSKSVAATTNRAHKVVLHREPTDNAWLMFLPGFKTKATGSYVDADDSIVVESLKFEGHFFNLGSLPEGKKFQPPPAVEGDLMEACAGMDPWRFCITPISAPKQEMRQLYSGKYLLGGDVVTIFHKECESFISVVDSSSGDMELTLVPASENREAGGQCLWRIERSTLRNEGSLVKWKDDRIRLRHLFTGGFLALENGIPVVRRGPQSADDALWSMALFQNYGSDEFVRTQSLVRIHSKNSTGTNEYMGVRTKKEGVEFFSSERMREDHVVLVSKVEKSVAANTYKALRAGYILGSFLQLMSDIPEISKVSTEDSPGYSALLGMSRKLDPYTTVLTDLIFCLAKSDSRNALTREGVPVVEWQLLLREHKFADLAVDIISAPIKKGLGLESGPLCLTNKEWDPFLRLIQMCYHALKLYCKENIENKMDMARFLPVVLDHSNGMYGGSHLLREIFYQCRPLLYKVDTNIINIFLGRMSSSEGRMARFCRFLSAILHCDGRPISANQELVTDLFFHRCGNDGFESNFLYDCILRERRDGVVFCVQEKGDAVILNKFLGKDDEIWNAVEMDLDHEEKILRYHVATVELLSELLLGRNQLAFNTIIRLQRVVIRYKDMLKVIFMPSLPHHLRRAYAELLLKLYMDRDPFYLKVPICSVVPQMEHGLLTRIQASENPFETAELRDFAPTNDFVDLKALCVEYLVEANGIDSKEKSKNALTVAVLEIVVFLLKYGFFAGAGQDRQYGHDMTEMAMLVNPLLDLLDGRDDITNGDVDRPGDPKRYRETEENLIIMKIKKQVLECFDFIYDVSMNVRVLYFHNRFSQHQYQYIASQPETVFKLTSTLSQSQPHEVDVVGKAMTEKLEIVGNYIEQKAQEEFLDGLKRMGNTRPPQRHVAPGTYTELREMAEAREAYDDERIMDEEELSLIAHEVVAKGIVHEAVTPGLSGWMVDTLLDLSNYEDTELVYFATRLLFKHMQVPSLFIKSCNDAVCLIKPATIRIASELSYIRDEIGRYTKFLPHRLRQDDVAAAAIAAERGHEDVMDQMTAVLRRLLEVLEEQGLDAVEIRKRQDLLSKQGVHHVVVNMIESCVEKGHDGQVHHLSRGGISIFQMAYTFLRLFCHRNSKNQQALQPHIDAFSNHIGINNLNVVDTICEIVRDNFEIVDRMAEGFFNHLARVIKTYGRRARWIRAFCSFLLVEGAPYKKNQKLALKVVFENDMLDLTCEPRVDPKRKRKDSKAGSRDLKSREELIGEEEHLRFPEDSRLAYHVACLELLYTVCLGKNRSSEAKIQGMFGFRETVLTVVEELSCTSNLPADSVRYVKTVYVKLIFALYLETNLKAPISEINWSSFPWFGTRTKRGRSFIEDCAMEIRVLAKRCEAKPDDHLDPHRMGAHIDLVYDGIIPCLREFYKSSFVPNTEDAAFMEVQLHQTHLVSAALAALMKSAMKNFAHVHTPARVAAIKDVASYLESNGCDELSGALLTVYMKPQRQKMSSKDLLNLSASSDDLDLGSLSMFNRNLKVLGDKMGVQDSARNMGRGLLDLAKLFGRPNHEESVGNLVRFLLAGGNIYSVDTIATCLRMMRVMVSLDPVEATPGAHEAQFRAVVENAPVSLSSEAIQRTQQTRYSNYKLPSLAAEFSVLEVDGEIDTHVSLAGLRLMKALLDGGNLAVQQALLDHFSSFSNSRFWAGVHHILTRVASDAKAERKRIVRQNKGQGEDDPADAQESANDGNMMQTALATQQAMELLKVLELLCVGRGSPLKDLMREQGNMPRSYNIIEALVHVLSAHVPQLVNSTGCDAILNIVDSILHTITMVVQGPNLPNQELLLNTQLIDSLNQCMLQLQDWGLETPYLMKLSRVRRHVVELLISLLEASRGGWVVDTMLNSINWVVFRNSRDLALQYATDIEESRRNTGAFAPPLLTLVTAARNRMQVRRDPVVVELTREANSCAFLVALLTPHDVHKYTTREAHMMSASNIHDRSVCSLMHSFGCSRRARANEGLCVHHAFNQNQQAIEILRRTSACVEIFRDGFVQPVYFNTDLVPERVIKGKKARERLLLYMQESYDDNAQERHGATYIFMHRLLFSLFSEYKFRRKIQTVWISALYQLTYSWSFYIGLVVNALVGLFDRSLGVHGYVAPSNPRETAVHNLTYSIMYIHLVVCSLTTALYFVYSWKELAFEKRYGEGPQKIYQIQGGSGRFHKKKKRRIRRRKRATTPQEVSAQDDAWRKTCAISPMTSMEDVWKRLKFTDLFKFWLSNENTWIVYFHLCAPLFSLFGIVVSPIFFVYHLIILLDDAVMKLVLQSVTSNFSKMYKTGILAIFLIYIFGILGFMLFPENNCSTVFMCSAGLLYLGAAGQPIDGDLSDFTIPATLMDAWSSSSSNMHFVRMIYEGMFGLIFILIVLAIISGIIIDSFGELRDKMQENQDNIFNKCFMCGLSRETLEDGGVDFSIHISAEHSLWHYMYFIAYITRQEPQRLSGMEQYARDRLAIGDLTIIPVGACSRLRPHDEK